MARVVNNQQAICLQASKARRAQKADRLQATGSKTSAFIAPKNLRADKTSFLTQQQCKSQTLKISCGGSAPASNGTPYDVARANRDLTITRFGMPSKGRMAEDTQQLLKDCQLPVRKLNPRQYTATVPQLGDGVEVWFQRASDVVRRLCTGDLDMGIVGYDMLIEYGMDDPELVVLHNSLNFGHCHLALALPKMGMWENIDTLDQLMAMPEWTMENPLRVVTGYHYIAKKFFDEKGFKNYQLLHADGALEAAPLMGSADIILDLVSTGTTLRENNLKEIEGGQIMESEGVLVARRSALTGNPSTLMVVREMIERLEAHLRAQKLFTVVANMRGKSQEEVAAKLLDANSGLGGLQGPTVGRVFVNGADGTPHDGEFYAITICVQKKQLYDKVKALRRLGGSGVMVSPLSYVFDEEPERWTTLLETLNIDDYDAFVADC
eukprot:CAMPEP_0197844708 /NCGR_PEP_ID=MMETSP1438-20131217/1691_1 /TAXON_ID=1461541 /ORGANISM="Pterosperma sp., Strain CCMP1384" /LENGTH=436 /DNA_ID=CAMNT_0043455647 /DNA_START=26 /DNA_END=1336 /DNA_ORIENTATION=-